ncbi:MAG: GAF domain-containing sensor histidine kinase, partial [Candidatus Dormibacteraeota bacterium]|nr:GAF domain-containing sensor histidine kinase [Candidatus Dormibacteraeota bacterium]
MVTGARRAERLVEAGMILSSELSLGALLQRLVEVAVQLTGARYGAIGVINEDGTGLDDFITTGIGDDERAEIGHLPQGRGILGVLIRDAHSLRLREIGADPRSYGFPAQHPPMHSFLGAPVRSRGRVFGNIYLTEKQGSVEFTEEDEEALNVLATQAGVAIENARLLDDSERRSRSLEAITEINAAILQGEAADDLLRRAVGSARRLVAADAATVVLPVGSLGLRIAVADGAYAADLEGMPVPEERSVSGEVIRTGEPVMLTDARSDSRTDQPMVMTGHMGPAIFVPLPGQGGRIGTLAVSRLAGGRLFEARDLTLLQAFAAQAAIAIEYAWAQRELERLTLLGDRERIARELHDGVIQALFAVGLGLQGTAALLHDDVVETRLQQAIGEIDRVIGDLRNYIFGLRPGVVSGAGLGDALSQLGHEFEERTGITVAMDVDPALEQPLSGVATHVVQMTRESLSNVARHAQAATCRVSLRRSDGRAVLEVDDDGVGFDIDGPAPAGLGLQNLRARAEQLGGRLVVTSPPGEGTTVQVSLPIGARPPS